MKILTRIVHNLWTDEAGQGMVEYCLILALIAVVVITILITLGTNIKGKYKEISDTLTPPSP